MRFQLGDKVQISGQIKKVNSGVKVSYSDFEVPSRSVDSLERDENGKKTSRWSSERRPITTGVIVGKRTLQNGEFYYEDGYPIYTPTTGEIHQVWLVSVAMDLKPIYCRDEQVKSLEV